MKSLFNHVLLPPFKSGLLENPTPEKKIKVHQITAICHREVLTKRVVAKKWPVARLVFASLPAPPHSTRNRHCDKKEQKKRKHITRLSKLLMWYMATMDTITMLCHIEFGICA